MAKIKIKNQPNTEPTKIKVANLPADLKPKPDNQMRLKIKNKDGQKKLVIQFRTENGQLQARQADGKKWVKVVENKPTKLEGNVRINGLEEYVKAQNAVAKQGPKGDPGEDGASVELRKANNFIQWKNDDESKWKNLVSLNELQGEPGKDGVTTVIGGGGGIPPTSGSGGGGTVESIVAGDNVTVDNTDPANPIISVIIPPDAGVMVIQAGDNIIVDSTVPSSPIIHAVMPSAYLLTGMFTNGDADISGYKYARPLTTYVEAVEGSTSSTVDTNPTILEEFVSLVNNPGISLIVAGIATVHYDTQKAGGTDNYYTYAEVYKRSRAGVETLLFTTDQSTTTAHNERQSVSVTAPNPNNITLNIRDRIVVKVYAVMDANTADIAIFYDGDSGSRLVYPTIISDSTAFVSWNDVIDEDNMVSNSDDKVPTQQSVKAYVDTRAINDLSDVTITSPLGGHVITWNGSYWQNNQLGYGSLTGLPTLVTAYSGLSDVNVVGTPANDSIMAWNTATGKWTVRATAPGAGSAAWGSITGTLSAQSDLNTALAGKVNIAGSQDMTSGFELGRVTKIRMIQILAGSSNYTDFYRGNIFDYSGQLQLLSKDLAGNTGGTFILYGGSAGSGSLGGRWNHGSVAINLHGTQGVSIDSQIMGLSGSIVTQSYIEANYSPLVPRVNTVASGATITIPAGTTDVYTVTALAVGTTIAAPTGTPVNGQGIILRIKDSGSAQTIGWNAIFRAIGVTLPLTTVISKTMYIGMIYNSADTKWDVIAVAQEA